MIEFYVPVKTVSEANGSNREHWGSKMRRRMAQQEEVHVEMHRALKGREVELPCVVKLTRIAPRLLDTDNLSSAFKAIRDAVAQRIGADDGDPRIKFEYDQVPIGEHRYSVKIQITSQSLI